MVKLIAITILLISIYAIPAHGATSFDLSTYETNTTEINNGEKLLVKLYLKAGNNQVMTNRHIKMSIGSHREYEAFSNFSSIAIFDFTIFNLPPGEYPVVFTDITGGESIELKTKFTLVVHDSDPGILPCLSHWLPFF